MIGELFSNMMDEIADGRREPGNRSILRGVYGLAATGATIQGFATAGHAFAGMGAPAPAYGVSGP